MINNNLRPSETQGKFVFKQSKEDEDLDLEAGDKDLLKLFDEKLNNMRKRVKGMIIDNSDW